MARASTGLGRRVVLLALVAAASVSATASESVSSAGGREREAGRVPATTDRPCRPQLRRLGVRFHGGKRARGVSNPVSVKLPLGGIEYFEVGSSRPDRRLFMACRLALALHRMGGTLKRRGIEGIAHFGIYKYRCIAGTNPCELSQHAHATAIDLHEFRDGHGRTYNVETDWLENLDFEETCSAFLLGSKNIWLHDLVCEWDRTDVFHVILTPNYNRDHRNHFHVDLTPGIDFID